MDMDKQIKDFGLTIEEYENCLDDIKDKVEGIVDIDWEDIVQKYNLPISRDTLRKASSQSIFGNVFVRNYFKKKESLTSEKTIEYEMSRYKQEQTIEKDGTFKSDKLILIKKNDLKDKNFLLKAHGFIPSEWELISARNNIWNVYSKQDGVQELYSSKIVVKPRTEISLEEIEKFYEYLLEKYKSPTIKRYEDNDSGYMLELPIFDLHIGKFSLKEDVGENNYNAEDAKECFNYIIDKTISKINKTGIEVDKIIFPIGQDFFHYDTFSKTTTGGTPQDTDLSSSIMFKNGIMLLIDGITKLSEELHTEIEVFCVRGNHDYNTSYHSLMALWCYFHNNENVTVKMDTSPRQYIRYGNCLIGYSHGDKEKKRISGIMQIEASKDWGETKYREWHLGHLHSEQVSEENGLIIRNISSIAGTDMWHHISGYVGAVRKTTCFIWDKENGLDMTFNIILN